MSINITSNGSISHNPALDVKSPAMEPITEPRPRDSKGRFTSPEVTNLDSAPKEVKKQILENARKLNEKEVKHLKSLYMEEIESTAPYIYNFVKDNGIVKRDVTEGNISACVYLNKGTESWYCFLTPSTAYGFHLSCGVLAEVLNKEEVMNLLPKYNILYWDAIQRV